MRRTLAAALTAPLLLLSACSDDAPEVVETPTTAEETTTDDAAATTEEPTTDDAAATTEGPSDEADAGGAEGQAAAERTKEWLVAFVNGEDATCDLMMDLESVGPMTDNEQHYEVCTSVLVTQASDMFGDSPEMASIIGAMEINGADVQGTTAVIDKDNFSPMFAEAFGDEVITLQKVEGEWYVDMNESFN